MNTEKSSGLKTILPIAFVGIGGYFLLSKYQKSQQEKAAQNATKDIGTAGSAEQQATLLKKYIGAWYELPNVDRIVELGKFISDWPAVVSAYNTLFPGENLEQKLRFVLSSSGYETFLSNLKAKGRLADKGGYGHIKKKDITTPKGAILFINDSQSVGLYKTPQDYPAKPLATVLAGKWNPKTKQATFIQAFDYEYNGGVKTTLYQVKLITGSIVWVNGARNIIKRSGSISGIGVTYLIDIA